MKWSRELRNRARTFWWVYIATLNRSLTVVFFACTGMLLAHDFIFVDAQELFSGGAELWELLYKLCLAFVASYIFYLVVVHTKRQRDKENLRPFLYTQTLRLAGEARNIIRDFKEQSGNDFEGDFPPSEEEVRRMCLALLPYGESPIASSFDRTTGVTTYINWLQYLQFHNGRTKELIARIYTAVPFLESEHLQVVIEVETCFYLRYFLDQLMTSPMSNTDLTFMAGSLYDYFEKAQRAEEYAHMHLTLSEKFEPQ